MIIYLLSALCVGLYTFYCFKYWSTKKVLCLPVKFPFLSPLYCLDGLGVVNRSDMVEYYREMKAERYRYAGVVTSIRSVLIVKDLGLIRDLLVEYKEFFYDRGFHYTDRYEVQLGNIVPLDGRKWKEMRSNLSPGALCKNLKSLLGNVLDVVPYLVEAIEDCASEKRDIDVRELFSCFTTDVITYHCYKINCHSYKRSSSKFCRCRSDRLRSLDLRTADEKLSRSLYNTMRHYMIYRERGCYNQIRFLSLNLSMKDWSEDKEEPLSLFEMVCRVNLFFYFSFDVCSTTLNFAVYELCRNPDIQEKVRHEIDEVLKRHEGVITWKCLRDMKYLDQVLDETMRLYPPVPNLVERCEKKGYKLRDTRVEISTICDVIIPLFSLHRDPEYFPDPEKFDPERFDPENEAKNPPFYMPYGEGLRECSSIRACTIQTKVGLVQILKNFRLKIGSKTRLPLRLNPGAFLKNRDVLYINAEKI